MCSHLLGHNTHVNADPKDIWQPIELRWIKNLSCNKWQMIWKPPPPHFQILLRGCLNLPNPTRGVNMSHLIRDYTHNSEAKKKKKKKGKIHAAWYSYQERHGVLLAMVKSQALAFIRSQAAGDRPRWRETGRGGWSSAAAAAAAAV